MIPDFVKYSLTLTKSVSHLPLMELSFNEEISHEQTINTQGCPDKRVHSYFFNKNYNNLHEVTQISGMNINDLLAKT